MRAIIVKVERAGGFGFEAPDVVEAERAKGFEFEAPDIVQVERAPDIVKAAHKDRGVCCNSESEKSGEISMLDAVFERRRRNAREEVSARRCPRGSDRSSSESSGDVNCPSELSDENRIGKYAGGDCGGSNSDDSTGVDGTSSGIGGELESEDGDESSE